MFRWMIIFWLVLIVVGAIGVWQPPKAESSKLNETRAQEEV